MSGEPPIACPLEEGGCGNHAGWTTMRPDPGRDPSVVVGVFPLSSDDRRLLRTIRIQAWDDEPQKV